MRMPWTRLGDDVQVEGYRSLTQIGSGGFSTVWVATESDVGRKVALKVARARDGETRRRFSAEAEIGRRWAATQGIVGILGLTQAADGRPVLVMPYYDQGTAADLLPVEHRLPAAGVADLVRQVAQGLDAMHRQQYVHRDVSPRNILRSREMGYAMGDLGCTRPANSIVQSPWTEALTPGYAAPEASDRTRVQTITSDVYGLAATAWALLTGVPPHGFPPDPSALELTVRYELRRTRRPAVDPLLQAGLSAGRADLLASALDPDPTRRPAGVLALADVLSGLPGSVSSGSVASGPVVSGPVVSGAVSSGPVSSGPVSTGPVSSGRVASGPVSSGLVSPGPAVPGPVRSGGQVPGGGAARTPVSVDVDSTDPIAAARPDLGPIQPPARRVAVADSTSLVDQPAKTPKRQGTSSHRRRRRAAVALIVVLVSFVAGFFLVTLVSGSSSPSNSAGPTSPHPSASTSGAPASRPLIDDLRIVAQDTHGVRLAWTPAADPDLLPVLQRAPGPAATTTGPSATGTGPVPGTDGGAAGTGGGVAWTTLEVDLTARSKRVRVKLPNPARAYCFRLMLVRGADVPVPSNQVCTAGH
jgi:serine/threonine protein kinase